MAKKFYYAVKRGREGPKIYDSWEECRMTVTRYSRAEFKKFKSLAAAEAWISPALKSFRDCTPAEQSAQVSTNLISAESGSSTEQSTRECIQPVLSAEPRLLDIPTTWGEDKLCVDTMRDKATRPTTIILSKEQADVLEKVKKKDNVFFTGPAGTGKTVLLQEIIRLLRSTGRRVAVTASTGLASINIGGTTLHSWAGIGLGEGTASDLSGKILGTKPLRLRWWGVESLIIDEISMISGVLFDKLEEIAWRVRKNKRPFGVKPFGGIQLIVTGDFCQLPPVPDRHEGINIPSTFAFEAKSWSRCIDAPMTLKQVFRQRDQAFVNMLNDMRWGQMSQSYISKIRRLSREIVYEDGIEPTELYPTRSEVENANNTRLAQIMEKPVQFDAVDYPGYHRDGTRVSFQEMKRLLDRLVALPTLVLKTGALVMLVKNLQQGHLVNGSTGKVIGLSTRLEAARRGVLIAGRSEPEDVRHRCVQQCSTQWPLVRFTSGSEWLCAPVDFTVNDAFGEVQACRTQVPLILAWALSVHKSQGQTLERVRVDLRNTFEKGQAYVALSRATTLETLEVQNFDPLKVMAHPRVIEWYEEMTKGPNKEPTIVRTPTDSDEYEEYLTDEAYFYPSP